MSNAIQTIVNADKEKQIKDLDNVLRLVTNNTNLLNDMEIKGAYAMPMAEVLSWLDAFKRSVTDQLNALRPASEKAGDASVSRSSLAGDDKVLQEVK